jgi:peptide alpha-N-acetyltransferase
MTKQLPGKEQATFRSVIRFYETKQYKKGVKAADQILKKFPDHGETLCMKGLTVSFLGGKDARKEEAYELVRRGLRNDMTSHVCWHVFGLLYRQDRDYAEAVKCYRRALKIEPENIQILRDLSLLQIHTRDIPGFGETRQRLLQTKSQNRMHWLGYCVAKHLDGDHGLACLIHDQYLATFNDQLTRYELSELHMYKGVILEESEKFEEADKVLVAGESVIVDKVGFLEARARVCFRLKKYTEAAEALGKLIAKIPENSGYALALLSCDEKAQGFWPPPHAPGCSTQSFPTNLIRSGCGGDSPWLGPSQGPVHGAWRTVGELTRKCKIATHVIARTLTPDEEEYVAKFFDDLSEKHPKSEALKFLPIYFLTGERLAERLKSFLEVRIRKGIPSLFSAVKPLYFLDGRTAQLDAVVRGFMKTLKADVSTFDGVTEEAPTTLTFAQLFFAQHLDFQGQWTEALEVLDEAIKDTPTLADLRTCKARVLKHMGALEQSSELLSEAREMDLADRFLNTMAVRGLMRKDDTEEALRVVLLFDFHSKESGNPEGNLKDMQVMWVEYYIGLSYMRKAKYGLALKKFHETFQHFHDIQEDQFDFHSYCFRKTTLRTYVRFLRMQDDLYSHKFYRRAAKAAMIIYKQLLDNPVEEKKESEEKDDANMTAAEKKKLKHQQKREAKSKEKQEGGSKTDDNNAGPKGKKDDDPKGEKLLQPEKIEEDSLKIVRNLCKYCALDDMTYKWAYYMHERRGKLLLCVQANREARQKFGYHAGDIVV